ncbi:C13 family peptidase [Pelomonas cellulosilytica]|uniref:C13 family peptidase n=1 Tax=Pelomonas cellulosilytica TaxID=2906762 RepID=A0ABS8XXF2_9BURK|nr:C13 family peptidase [Pelomonas sp. P8]MCE4557329.1 C13 family peptidase [Pelomonas sp. P8]
MEAEEAATPLPADEQAGEPVPAQVDRGGVAWLREGARVLVLQPPRWAGLAATPWMLAWLVLAGYALALVMQRSLMGGEPRFLWNGILSGWLGLAWTAWLCWLAARACGAAERAGTLLAVSMAASLVLTVAQSALWGVLRLSVGPVQEWPTTASWATWGAAFGWAWVAQSVLLGRVAGPGLTRVATTLLMVVPLAVGGLLAPVVFWWPEPPARPAADAQAGADDESDTGLPLTDDTIVRQAELLATALRDLKPPQRGRVNVYAVTYAPNASENVFMRESAAVAATMRERFGAGGRTVQLVANRATTDTLPWATPAHLRATIARMAAVMDRDRDVLLLHLTSHGGRDGHLANDTEPLRTEPVTPAQLKQWLDEAGVRWRVISVSACYSGSWIAPLAGDGTLVMTAADADHTSYGCGKRSELTFFGRAMYVDALRETRSFTEAHAKARLLIDQREKAAGKSDGYSNPQISEGAGVHRVLDRLQQQLDTL